MVLLESITDALEKPGRAVRGLATGKVRELGNLIPFSDTLGITDARDRTTGRDLTDAYGLTGKSSRGWGASAAGFGAEMLTDPLSWLGAGAAYKAAPTLGKGLTAGAKSLTGLDILDGAKSLLLRQAGNPAKVAARSSPFNFDAMTPAGSSNLLASWGVKPVVGGAPSELADAMARAPYTPGDIGRIAGGEYHQITPTDAGLAYSGWADGLTKDQRQSFGAITGWPFERVAYALRGAGSRDPFLTPARGGVFSKIPFSMGTADEVRRGVVPTIDAALAAGAAPRDLMTYRLAKQVGDLNPGTATGMVGGVVSDPHYLHTTVDPWGKFYGSGIRPDEMMLDIMVPKGTPSGYLGSMSAWDAEKELLLPRSSQLQVADVRQVPISMIDHQWHRLDPDGKPIPIPNHSGGNIFNEDADEWLEEFTRSRQVYGDWVVPDDIYRPGWRSFVEANTQANANQTSALLRFLTSPKAEAFDAAAAPRYMPEIFTASPPAPAAAAPKPVQPTIKFDGLELDMQDFMAGLAGFGLGGGLLQAYLSKDQRPAA